MIGQHKLLAASKAGVWGGKDNNLGCPASAVLALLCPDRELGEAASIGTKAHAAAESILKYGESSAEAISLREEIVLTASAHVIQTMNTYVIYIKSKKDAGLTVDLEVKLSWSPLVGGTSDAIITDEDFAIIECADLKTGKEEVGPESNQIGTYLVAKRKSLGIKGRDYIYVGTIIQGDKIKTKQWTHDDLDKWEDTVKNVERIVTNILAMGVPAVDYEHASDYNCQWCPAKGICHGYAANMFPGDSQAKESFGHIKKALVPAKKPATLSIEERAALILAKPNIEKWLAEVEKTSLAEAQAGTVFPGLKLGTKKAGLRDWIKGLPIDTIATRLIEEGNLSEEQIYTKPSLLTPAQAEKLGAPAELLAKLSIRSEGKAALVPANTIQFED